MGRLESEISQRLEGGSLRVGRGQGEVGSDEELTSGRDILEEPFGR